MESTNQTRNIRKSSKQILIELGKKLQNSFFFCENKNLFKICKAENYNCSNLLFSRLEICKPIVIFKFISTIFRVFHAFIKNTIVDRKTNVGSGFWRRISFGRNFVYFKSKGSGKNLTAWVRSTSFKFQDFEI